MEKQADAMSASEHMGESAESDVKDASAKANASSTSVEDLQTQVDELRAENEQLKAGGGAVHTRHGWRWTAAVLLIVFGSMIALGGIGAFWVDRFLMNTDVFVATLSPLAQDPRVQASVSQSVDQAITNNVNIEASVTRVLTAVQQALVRAGVNVANLPVQSLAGPITGAIQGQVRQATSAFVASPQFQQLWDTSLRSAHQAFLAALNGTTNAQQSGIITFQGDSIFLNVNAFANAVKTKLVSSGLTFLNNVPLTRAQGQIKILTSPLLITFYTAVRTLNVLAWVLPLLALVMLGGAVFAAPDRRRGLMYVGVGLIVVTFIGLAGINIGRIGIQNVAAQAGAAAGAITAAYAILPAGLVTLLRLFFGIGLLLLIGTVLVGPAAWAVSLREWLAGLVNGTGSGAKFAEFVMRWRTPLAGLGVLLGVLAIIAFPVTAVAAFWIAVVVLIWLFAVETIGRGGRPAGGTPEERQPERYRPVGGGPAPSH